MERKEEGGRGGRKREEEGKRELEGFKVWLLRLHSQGCLGLWTLK